MKRYQGISGLKGIAILLIVLLHVGVNGNYNINDYINQNTISQLGIMVQLFFMVSAFGMCCGYYNKIKNNEISLNEFYGKRYRKIWPFFMLIVLMEVIFSGLSKKIFTEAFLDATLVFGFLPKGNIEVVGIGWTLGVIFAFYILFPFFVFLMGNRRRAWMTLAVCLIIRFACGEYFVNDGSTVMVNVLLWSTQFVTGGLIFLYKDMLVEKLHHKKILQISALLILVTAGIINGVYLHFDEMDKILLLLIFGMLIIYAISNHSFLLENRAVMFVGRYCLEIYLSHMVIFRLIEKLSLHQMINNQAGAFVFTYILTVVGTLAFSVAVNYVLERIGKVFNERINA